MDSIFTIPLLTGLNLELIEEYPLAGFILFKKDIEDPLQISELTNKIQKKSLARWGRPMLLAIDQEGGRVSRLREPFTQFPGMEELGSRPDSIERVREYARITALEMRLVGLNMNLAPVLDVRRQSVEEHLKGRTLSDSPIQVGTLGTYIIKTMQAHKVWCVAKHFPGLGKATTDPHTKGVYISCSLEEMEQMDLIPFRMAIQAGVSGIMTSHAVYDCFDKTLPGTFSVAIIELLRKQMNFDGLIVTDDILMGAIHSKWNTIEAALSALKAGHDIILISDGYSVTSELLNLLSESNNGGELAQRLNTSKQNLAKILSCINSTFRFSDPKEIREYFHLDLMI